MSCCKDEEDTCDLCETGPLYLYTAEGRKAEVVPFADLNAEYWVTLDSRYLAGYVSVSPHDRIHLEETKETVYETFWPVSLIAWEE